MLKLLSAGLLLLVVLLSLLLVSSKRALNDKDAVIARLSAEIEDFQGKEQQQPATRPIALSNPERSELLRLRAEVTRLKAESKPEQPAAGRTRHIETAVAAPMPEIPLAGDRLFQSRTNAPANPGDEAVRQALNQKEAELQAWWKAFKTYAALHNGDFPVDFTEAAPYLPTDFQNTLDVGNFMRPTPDAVRVNLKSLENAKRTVLFKERVPLTLSDGLVCNVYLLADGSVELFQE